VHTNHLNRALKEVMGHTTTGLIADRVLHESKMLLGRTTWPVAQIADALGFTEPAHFSNFFRKHTDQSPMQFRAV
jgi:AraC-like DNA-binding protein